MAQNKTNKFNSSQIRMAELTKALAHPARIAILEILCERATCICGDITDELPLAQSTISQHLKVLKKSRLIKGEVDGTRVCYCLDTETVNEFDELMAEFSKHLNISVKSSCSTGC